MTGPRKTLPIIDIVAHAADKKNASEFAQSQDWSNASCTRCYFNWLHTSQSKDSWACSGSPVVCVDYHPELLPEAKAASMSAFYQFCQPYSIQ